MDFTHDLKIPKARIAVLIGEKGEVKKRLEAETSCSISIDSKEGDVSIQGSDSLKLYTLKEIITAIARGFNPEIAERLLKQDYALEVINVHDFIPNPNHAERIKGRVIGEKGRSRETIERLTRTSLSVYGKTISIIGEVETISLARKAVEALLSGSTHAAVYRWLEKAAKDFFKPM
ncbi:MAG: RNA-processing protein [Candidatus Woesearchaeota archaeon]|nr:MAG: RNA-processing protein [Candidatus Woesearchaeota archaeon]